MNKGRRDLLAVLEGKERRHSHDREMRFNSKTVELNNNTPL